MIHVRVIDIIMWIVSILALYGLFAILFGIPYGRKYKRLMRESDIMAQKILAYEQIQDLKDLNSLDYIGLGKKIFINKMGWQTVKGIDDWNGQVIIEKESGQYSKKFENGSLFALLLEMSQYITSIK